MSAEIHHRRRTGQQPNVLARFQGLFPHSPQLNNNGTSLRSGDSGIAPSPKPQKAQTVDSKFLKIRILTWNMHDSLPKGDLEELLGKVPSYNTATAQPGSFPTLAADASHPYHLVVIAGQECPTPSGIPMGLGAGFKRLDKERDRKEGEKDHEKHTSKSKERERLELPKTPRPDDDLTPELQAAGWTSMVEEWLCNGGGSSSRTVSPSTGDIGAPRPLLRQKSAKDPRKGPYQLLIKDRLMGIYLAVYIHRDLKPLVRGMSKASVTAGLIGGRLGNKGGVGISLDIDGTTFLFMNAHLAAHEGRINHRLANLAKIKAELAVDNFLAPSDERNMAEDLTDKFDFTFLTGDLNFRLDISRLHADWLISRQEYAQAFEFDQLNTLMKNGVFFDGFHEAPIDFPPTFKYDVLRTLKRSKRTGSKLSRLGDQTPLTEAEEREIEEAEDDDDAEGASLMSSAMTSINSRPPTEPGMEDDSYFYASPSTVITSTSKVSVVTTGASKARAKFMSLLSPSFVISPKFKSKHSDSWGHPSAPNTPMSAGIPPSPLSARPPLIVVDNGKKKFLRPPPMILANHSGSQNNFLEAPFAEEKGVYDSSSKKRVPSWCDRILWKTTIEHEPEPTYEEVVYELDHQTRPRSRVGQLFSNPFRPTSGRSTIRDPNTPTFTSILSGGPEGGNRPPLVGLSPAARADYRLPLSADFRQPESRISRRAYTTFSPPPTAPLPSELPPRRSTVESPLSAERPQSLWRFLPAFLSPTHTHPSVLPDIIQPFAEPIPRKGDVICLTYNTLDDKGMRRLEGRSDHRPVIGGYAVYI